MEGKDLRWVKIDFISTRKDQGFTQICADYPRIDLRSAQNS